MRWKPIIRTIAGVAMMTIGLLHFLKPASFVQIVPTWLPAALLLVYISGAAEIAGGLGLLLKPVRYYAAIGLVLLYIAVFPANVNMAIHNIQPEGSPHIPQLLLWLRLPFQALFISLAWWFRK